MLRSKVRSTIAVIGATLIASSLLLSGCGRTSVNPLAPSDDKTAGEPGGEDPGEDPGWDDPVPMPGGGGVAPRPGGGGVAPVKPGTGPKPAGGLRPLPKPTSTPGFKAPGGGGAAPAVEMGEFVDLLGKFGYDPGAREVQNVRMQVAVVNRVPAERFHWVDGPGIGLTYGHRAKEFPYPISYEQWKADGAALAQRYQGISYYVGRRALYRDILRDRYNDTGSDAELVMYKRLNRTQFFVSYRADGQIDDYGYFRVDDWRNFLPVPGAYWN